MADPGDGLAARHDATPHELRELYDRWVPTYDADVDDWGYVVPERVAELLAERVDSGTVLDAGCGTGLVGVRLAAAVPTITVVGLDLSPESAKIARERGVYERVHVGTLDEPLPFSTDTVAGVVCAGVLTYVTDESAAFREFVRVCAPGGRIVVTHRTDLWEANATSATLERIARDLDVSATWTEPQTYLPGHPDYGDDIRVIYATIDVGR